MFLMFGRKPKDPADEAVEIAEDESLEAAEPSRFWFWVILIALLGVAGRLYWFSQYGHEIDYVGAGQLANTFATGYGQLLGLINSGTDGDPRLIAETLWVLQSGMIALATLMVFALGRRVLFGWAELVPPILLNLSIALTALAGEIAPAIPTMFFLTTGIWLAVMLRERPPEEKGARPVLLALGAGLAIGLAILFNPAVLLPAIFIAWWSFRAVARDLAILLTVAIVLIPAGWQAYERSASTPATFSDATTWITDNSVKDGPDALNHAYAVATIWNPRFARGAFSSTNWNYEWIIPQATRQGANYVSSTRILAGVFMLGFVLLTIAGIVTLFFERAGSESRLLAIPLVTFPLATFLIQDGNLLRVPILPFLVIALTLGAIWVTEELRRGKPTSSSDMDE